MPDTGFWPLLERFWPVPAPVPAAVCDELFECCVPVPPAALLPEWLPEPWPVELTRLEIAWPTAPCFESCAAVPAGSPPWWPPPLPGPVAEPLQALAGIVMKY